MWNTLKRWCRGKPKGPVYKTQYAHGRVPVGAPSYHEGPVYDTSGASREVFNKPMTYPLLAFRGNGRVAGNLVLLDVAQIHNQVATVGSIGQPPAIAGSWQAAQDATKMITVE